MLRLYLSFEALCTLVNERCNIERTGTNFLIITDESKLVDIGEPGITLFDIFETSIASKLRIKLSDALVLSTYRKALGR